MSGTYERTFTVSVPVERAWRACTHPDAFGARLGREHGDLLVEVAGAPVFGYRELWTVARATPPGRETTASWIRDGELHHGWAVLSPRPAPAVVA